MSQIGFIKKPKIHFSTTESLNDQLNTITCAFFKVYTKRCAETDLDKCENVDDDNDSQHSICNPVRHIHQ